MPDINPESIKEIVEIPALEAGKYLELGWVEVDTYRFKEQDFSILVWISDAAVMKP